MLKYCRNLLIASEMVALVGVVGCGSGVLQTVHAAEGSTARLTSQVANAGNSSALLTVVGALYSGGTVGQTVDTQLRAAGGQSPYNWTLRSGSLAPGLSLSGSGRVNGTLSAPGTYVATLQIADSSQQAQTQTLTMTVLPSALTITSAALPAGTAGSAYAASLQSSGGTAPFTWSLASGSLPQGLTLSSTGVVSGTPTQAGTSSFAVKVVDASSPAQSRTQALAISVAALPLRITPVFLAPAQQGSNFNTALQASGGSGSYSWSVVAGSLPTGVTLSNTGVISGSPTTAGTSFFTVAVQDTSSPVQRVTAGLSMNVAVSTTPLSITTTSLANGTVGSPLNVALAATGGTPGYTWSITSGSLPTGLSLSSAGIISGTPVATSRSSFTVAVIDNGNPSKKATQPLSLMVKTGLLSINTAPVPTAEASRGYAAQLSATGGTPGYTWSISSGSLPSGLSLQATTGAILGTPASAGSSTFTYTVTDSAVPQQRASATATIAVTEATAATGFTTWFVRPDGGNRYSNNNTAGQCDGKADRAYSGKGTNQHCAFNDVRYMWLDGTMGNGGWVMSGGDTLVIRGCSALPTQMNPDDPHCRIGWDKNTGNDLQNFWCWYADNYCSMPSPPNGTAALHTRILGGCAYDGNCNPVNTYPYTNNNLTQLFAGFQAGTLMNMYGSKYVDVQGLELTSHNGQCARYGAVNALPSCKRGGTRPLSDAADQAIATDNTTSNILLQDVYIHGFNSSGIVGPIGGPITLKRVSIDFNTFAAWNLDDGNSTPNAPGSSITQSYVTMVGNGCQEEYPITHTQFPAKGCWDTATGGFGDAWSGQSAALDSFTCDHCTIAYNTKDAAIGPHTQIKTLSLTNSFFGGNMGQQGKWGMQDNSTALIANNMIIGNCNRMSQQLPGAAQNFNVNTNQLGSGLSGFCRAAGDVFAFYSGPNSSVQIANNTVVALSPTVFDLTCNAPGACSSTPYNFTNNIFLGYTLPSYPASSGRAPGLYYLSDSSVPIAGSHNIEYGVRNGDQCGLNGNMCTDPLLVNEPAQGTLSPESLLDYFNYHPSLSSPALGAGVSYIGALAQDFYGALQSLPLTLGAVAR